LKRSEVYNLLSAVGVPCAYHHFPESSGQQPPFICFYYSASDNFRADNADYKRIDNLTVELYTDDKDFALEESVEAALSGLVWSKDEEYIDSEKMYMITYRTELTIEPEITGQEDN
jgi:hypothetical protein